MKIHKTTTNKLKQLQKTINVHGQLARIKTSLASSFASCFVWHSPWPAEHKVALSRRGCAGEKTANS